MRVTAAVGLAAILACVWPGTGARAEQSPCKNGPDTIGVSRVVEIDTSSGPRFGHLQYRDIDFLKDGEIVLTFDDGPSRRYTPPILDALDAHCTKATFFTVGRMAIADPEMLQETAMRGHTIGSHTWSHKNLGAISADQARAEFELGLSTVQAALGAPVAPFFRFPYLSDPQSIQAFLQQRGVAIFSIDADSYDFRTPDPATVQRNILSQLAQRRKGILLFHDIQPSTARALKGLLDELRARGYRVVHIVPKYPAATVAEFDEMADQVLKRKRLAVTGSPLAGRSSALPIAGSPGSTGSHASNADRPASRARPPRPGEEDRWQDRVFQN